MTPRMFDVRFPHGTQLTFGLLMFATREERLASVHGQDMCHSVTSSTLGGACTGLDSCAGLFICTSKLVRGLTVVTSILRPSTRASSSSSLATSPDQDSSDDYSEIKIITYGDSVGEGHLIFMVSPAGDPSHNSSN
jgi:hypothetical protein